MWADDMKRLKQFEVENAQLKKLLAEPDLEIEVMKEVATENGERARPPVHQLAYVQVGASRSGRPAR
jgi:hypothetical protein